MQGAVIHKTILCYDTFIVAPPIPCRTHSVSTYTDIVQIIWKEPDMEGMHTCFEHQHQTAIKNVDSLPLAMAYVPWQSWKNIYKAEVSGKHPPDRRTDGESDHYAVRRSGWRNRSLPPLSFPAICHAVPGSHGDIDRYRYIGDIPAASGSAAIPQNPSLHFSCPVL